MSNGKHNSKKSMKELKPWTLPKTISIDSWLQARNDSQTRPGGNAPTVEEFYQEFRPTLFYDWWVHMNQQLPQQQNPRIVPGSSQGRKTRIPPNPPLNLYICPPLIIPQLAQPVPHSVSWVNNFEGYPAGFYQSPQHAFFSLPFFSGFNYTEIPSTSKVFIEPNGTRIEQGTSSTVENKNIRQSENVNSENQVTAKTKNKDKLNTFDNKQKHCFNKIKIEEAIEDSESEEEHEDEIDFEF
ncbi:uncharacterized protein LOC106667782 isoform X2 [Cimex lectularius]|uniref:Uncharacterized protein n=1 Tax=Cimex lectularius TaxID=79782 RepID=A0A8I6SK50_CIMLE|nr:uncharacterized protein LOC106667782 isoform X2 [Cimex lectularius]